MILLHWLTNFLQTPHPPSPIDNPPIYQLAKSILLKIDAQFFRQLANKHQEQVSQTDTFDLILKLLERYIVLKEFKKLTALYHKEISLAKDAFEILALVLYVSVNSDIREEIIESILGFTQDEQRQLMEAIQRIDGNCEKLVEFKKIVEKIESIEQENDGLRGKILQNQQQYRNHVEAIDQFSTSNALIYKEISEYEQEKRTIFKELEINRIQEFAQICLLNKQQNSQLASSLSSLEEEHIGLTQQNLGLKKQLKSYGQTIQRQIKEIEDLKSRCKVINQDYWLGDFGGSDCLLQIPALPLRDSKHSLNIERNHQHSKRKISTDRTQCSNRHQALEESFEVRHNLHTLISLEELQQQQRAKQRQIERLRQFQREQLAKQRKLQRKIRKIQECHNSYTGQYFSAKLIKQ